MTPIELRTIFKIDTGYYPLWGLNGSGNKKLDNIISGTPKTIYGEWLEKKIRNFKEVREKYYKETGFYGIRKTLDRREIFKKEYSYWLEEQLIKKINKYAQVK